MSESNAKGRDSLAAFRIPEFGLLLAFRMTATLCYSSIRFTLAYQIYDLTHNPAMLGWLGLLEAIPVLTLALYGGHVADRRDRRQILLASQTLLVLCTLTYVFVSHLPTPHLFILYGLVFISAMGSGLGDPALSGLEAQIVPVEHTINASSWLSNGWLTTAIFAGALSGWLIKFGGIPMAYTFAALMAICSLTAMCLIKSKGAPKRPDESAPEEPLLQSVRQGIQYVFKSQVLVASMAMDLFAVLFGGVIALLPVFARDILHIDAGMLGWLVAAPTMGSAAVTLLLTRHPIGKGAGRIFLVSVAAFGASIICFAFSHNYWLSFGMLFISGVGDGVSMVVRRTIMRIMTPNHMRGRVSSVSQMFISSSNELGAWESGFAAKAFGPMAATWGGGIVTLIVVSVAAWKAPELRNLDFSELRDKTA